MNNSLTIGLLVGLLLIFATWQMRRANNAEADLARQQTLLDAQAEAISRLESLGKKIDEALEFWREKHETIAKQRENTRQKTRDYARKDPTLREQLDSPLHPALRPGGGLLGRQNGSYPGGAGGAPLPDPAP